MSLSAVFHDEAEQMREIEMDAIPRARIDGDYPDGATAPESQIITLKINEKEFHIKPLSNQYSHFEITCGEERYSLKLNALPKITKELVTCLTQHAVRLKKSITFTTHRNDIIHMDTNKNEIVFVRFDTEHYSGRTTRIKHLEFPNKKIKCEDIEQTIGRRLRIYYLPENKERIGFEFKDLRNNPIAYMSNNVGAIFLLWNILIYKESPIDLSIIYLDYILTNYSAKCDEIKEKAMEILEQKRNEQRKIKYKQFIDRMFHDSIHALHTRMTTCQSDMDSHMRGLNTKGKELVRDTDFLKKLNDRSNSKEIKTQLEIDYKLISKLRKTNKYTNFRFDAGSIVGQTSMIKFFNKYEIGIFDVYLSLNGVVKCYNKTYNAPGDYGHPHINHGNPCWGNLGEAVFKMLRSNQFGAAFDMMYEFLMRYNDGRGSGASNRPYQRLEQWNPAFLQQGLTMCDNCHRIKELCGCGGGGGHSEGRCGNCNRSYEECGCDRCPAEPFPNNILGEHVQCGEDCEHYNQDDGCCGY